MSDKPDDKDLLNERLPDPKLAAADLAEGAPRKRTAEHLKRLLRAGLALQLAGEIAACQPAAGNKPEPPRPTPEQKPTTGYAVVDPMPLPAREVSGFLHLESTPSGIITIDGTATTMRTPQERIVLSPGTHTITITVPNSNLEQTFTIEIRSGVTRSEMRDLRKPPAR